MIVREKEAMLPNGDGGTLRLRVYYILLELELEERGKEEVTVCLGQIKMTQQSTK